MSINHLLVALSIVAPPNLPASEADQQRLCSVGPRGSVQLTYRPNGNPVFGSDGLTCATVKPNTDAARPVAPRGRAQERLSTQPVGRFNNTVETGP
jgi:hypothetical protein